MSAELAQSIRVACQWSSANFAAQHIYRCVSWSIARGKLRSHDPAMSKEQLAELEAVHHRGGKQDFVDGLALIRRDIQARHGISVPLRQSLISNINRLHWANRISQIVGAFALSELSVDELFFDLIVLERPFDAVRAKASNMGASRPLKSSLDAGSAAPPEA